MRFQLFGLPRAALALCMVLMSLQTPAIAANVDEQLRVLRVQMQEQKFTEALATASAMVRANPRNYQGHYYVAMAEMGLDHVPEARAAVAAALQLAPPAARPAVEKLAKLVEPAPAVQAPKTSAPAGDIFINCTYNDTTTYISSSDTKDYGESSTIHRVRASGLSSWNASTSTWGAEVCTTCTLGEKVFQGEVATVDAATDSNPYKYKRSYLINRVTGEYRIVTLGTSVKDEDWKRGYRSVYSGSCRPVRDPELAQPKF